MPNCRRRHDPCRAFFAGFTAGVLLILPMSQATAARANCAGESYLTAPDGLVFCKQHFPVQGSSSGRARLAAVQTACEKAQISIRGVTIAFISPGFTTGYVFSGNSFNHDTMAWLDPGREVVVRQWFPDGLSFQFPGLAEERPSTRSGVDLHVQCEPAGDRYSGWLIINYTIP